MQPRAIIRSLLAASIAASLAACGDQPEDVSELVEQQVSTQEQTTQIDYTGSTGTDPIPPVMDGPSTTEMLTIEVPGGKDADGNYLAYPWNPDGDAFWYGLDEATVTVPAASDADKVYHLTFAGEFAVDGEAGPGAELIETIAGKSGDITVVFLEGTHHMNSSLRVDMSLDPDVTSLTLMG